ncbi:MAG TPA: hypothetical protein VIL40_00170 [Thermaerobacter sp.]
MALTGTWLVAMTVALLALDAVPGARRLGLPPGRLALWGGAWLLASAPLWPVGDGTGALAVSPGGAGLPLVGAGLWFAGLSPAARRRAALSLVLTTSLAYALLRGLPGSVPPWLSPVWAAGVVTGVAASLAPLAPPAGLVLATAGMVLAQGLWAGTAVATGGLTGAPLPLRFAVAGGAGHEAIAVSALTATLMALLGGDGASGGAGDPQGNGATDVPSAPAGCHPPPPRCQRRSEAPRGGPGRFGGRNGGGQSSPNASPDAPRRSTSDPPLESP